MLFNKEFQKFLEKKEKQLKKPSLDDIFRKLSLQPMINEPRRYIVNRILFWEYGRAVNYCVREGISIEKIELISKSKEIEKVCGRRSRGTPIQFPFELDYYCPLCGKEPIKVGLDNEIELLHLYFSEYNYFMWCERCNIDIPSFLCLKVNNKYMITLYKKIFRNRAKMSEEDKWIKEMNSFYRAIEPEIKIKNIKDLKRQIAIEERKSKGRPDTIKLMRLRDLLHEFKKMNLERFL